MKRDMKHFSEHSFLHDVIGLEWENITLIPVLIKAWEYFYACFSTLVNKHAPFKRNGVKGRK